MEDKQVACGSGRNSEVFWWRKLWSARVPSKVKITVWQTFHRALAARSHLARRGVTVDLNCPRCGDMEEDSCHALWLCPAVWEIWMQSAIGGILERFKGGPISAFYLHAATHCHKDDFDVFYEIVKPKQVVSKHKWKAPEHGYVKLTVEVAIDYAICFIGIGVVARDD
ncbi:hypothetical protein TIFTF001_005873 [Ficus carica]|uniref:Reverse transcriptase zinc-binding domain-containing protein n=1 Tax=Ficus carica TaxID=3494 RepID=A0AA88DF52_FICCA|nr:hypothetical protein TIFTF001_005873 [Ficus carica]